MLGRIAEVVGRLQQGWGQELEDDAIRRAKAYEAADVDALFFTGIKAKAELEAISAATRLPIILGGAPEAMSDPGYLREQRVKIALQGHAPISAATKAVYETLKALREGLPPKALTGLASVHFTVSPAREPWLGPIVGVLTGLVAAATGVFAMPAVIYLQAIGIEKEDLVQALGLSFTISSLALAVNLASVSALNLSLGPASIGALAVACIGMWLGQTLRLRLRPETFRLCFLFGLLALGVYLVARAAA